MNDVVEGFTEPGWERVGDVFRGHFDRGLEQGAAVAVYVAGKPVVDLWGGCADPTTKRNWNRDTLVTVMSTTKGAVAICLHMLVERGLLDVDAPVARYWPEFADAGKEEITVRLALSHQAGLPWVDRDLTFEEVCAYRPVIDAIAAQAPHSEPGSRCDYHALTWGFIAAELIARVTGSSAGTFLARDVAAPLGLRTWLGLPEELEPHVARLDPPASATGFIGKALAALVLRKMARALTFGGALPLTIVDGSEHDFNSRRLREVEVAGAGLVTDARSLARLYAATVSTVDGVRLLTDETVRAATELQTTHHADPPFGLPRRDFSLGFTTDPQLLSATSFGFNGHGGSLGFADIDSEVGFGYVMNKLDGFRRSNRELGLVAAVKECLG